MTQRTIFLVGASVLVAALVVGCATGGKQASDEALVQNLLASWKAAVVEKNIDKILATYGDDFSHDGIDYQAKDKAALRKFIEECQQAGYFDSIEIASEAATTTIQGDTAKISRVDATNTQGMVTVELIAKKGASGWLISDMAIEGL